MLTIRCTLALLLLNTCMVQCQSMQFSHLMNHENLDYSAVYDLYEDPEGFLWIGTDNGAWRYDGVEIKQFVYSPSSHINSFHYLKEGIILAGCDRGIFIIPRSGKAYLKSINANKPAYIAGGTNDHNIWLISEGKIYCLNENIQIMDVHDLTERGDLPEINSGEMSTRIAADGAGNCYFIQGGKVYAFQYKAKKIHRKVLAANISKKALRLSRSMNGNVWIQCTDNDSTNWLWNPLNEERKHIHAAQDWIGLTDRFFVASHGDVYFSHSDDGLIHLIPKTGRIRKIRSNPYDKHSLSGGPALLCYEDRNHCLWVATPNGLDQSQALNTDFKYYSFVGFSEQLRYEKPSFYDAVWQNDSTCLMTSSTHYGLIQLDLNRGSARFAGRNADRYVDRPVSLIRLKDSYWLVSCINGNFIYNEKTGELNAAVQHSGLPEIFSLKSTVKASFDDNHGNVFISVLNHLSVYRYNRIHNSWFRYNFSSDSGSSGTFPLPSFIAGTVNDHLEQPIAYFVNDKGITIAKYDYIADRFSTIKLNNRGYTPRITDIDCDKNGQLWLTSEKALYLFNPGNDKHNLTRVNEINDYIKDKTIKQTLVIQNGNVWITTNKGLINYQPEEHKIALFNSADGLSEEALGYCIRYNQQNKHILCTTESGILYFDPQKVRKHSQELFPLITGIEVNGRTMDLSGNSLNLNFDQRNLVVYYTAPCLSKASTIYFSYVLEGFQQKWSSPSVSRIAEFSQLPAGNYTLRIRVGFDGLTWKETAVPLLLTIKKPIYQRPLFILSSLLSVAGIIILWVMAKHKMKLKQIMVSQEIRNRISRDLHDDLGSALSSISFISNVGQHSEEKKARYYHELIGTTARGMIDSMNDIVWVVNPKNDSIESMVSRMRRFSSTLFEARSINLLFKEESTFSRVTLTMQERRNIYFIFKEIVNNSAKHSACTDVEIVLQKHTYRFCIKISDNGTGFDTEKPYIGNGLSNMKARAKEIGAVLDIRSSPGSGSSFLLYLS